jgi:hypothetical protein
MQFIRCASTKGEADEKSPGCFEIDDTDIEKCGRTFEGISKIYSHKEHCYLFGFKLLPICYWDGKSLIPCGLSLHRESKKNNYGLTGKQRKRQFTKKGYGTGYFQERYDELDEEKPCMAIKMLKSCVKRGILGSYVLMDSWFVNDFMLREIRKIRRGILHVAGICKMDKRKFVVNCQLKPGGFMIFSAVSKKDALFAKGKPAGKDRFEVTKGANLFFYDTASVNKEFSKYGLMDFFEIEEPVKFCRNLPSMKFTIIKCKK